MESEFKAVFQAETVIDAKMVCGLLQAQDIEAFMRDEFIDPHARLQGIASGRALHILVPSNEAEAARAILKNIAPDQLIPDEEEQHEHAELDMPSEPAYSLLAEYDEEKAAQTCYDHLCLYGYAPELKHQNTEAVRNEPNNNTSPHIPWQIFVIQEELQGCSDCLMLFEAPEPDSHPTEHTEEICPRCASVRIQSRQESLQYRFFATLNIICWVGFFGMIALFHLKYLLLIVSWMIGLLILYLYKRRLKNKTICLNCKSKW